MQDLPWIVGAVLFACWFTFFEWRAFAHPEKNETLSRFMWKLGKWRPSIAIWGFVIGGLTVHFWWNWDPSCVPPGVGG